MNMEKLIQIVKGTDNIFFDDKLRNDVSVKGAADYVTKADISISQYLHTRLHEEYPHIGFISEEEEISTEEKEYWILDPIDGTTNFMHQVGLSALSLGYCAEGEVKAGIIYNPHTRELFWAEKGKGAFLNGTPIHCSEVSELSESLGMIDYNPYYKESYMEAFSVAYKMYRTCQDIRTLGSAALELVYVACGRADVALCRYLKPWDYAAALIIIREAGGMISDLNREVDIRRPKSHMIAAAPAVYEKFLELIHS